MARESSDFISQFNTTQFAHTELALGYDGGCDEGYSELGYDQS